MLHYEGGQWTGRAARRADPPGVRRAAGGGPGGRASGSWSAWPTAPRSASPTRRVAHRRGGHTGAVPAQRGRTAARAERQRRGPGRDHAGVPAEGDGGGGRPAQRARHHRGRRALAERAQPGAGPPLLPFAELETAPQARLVDSDPDGLAALLYTGGTTGRSKGVMISHNALSAAAWAATATSYDECCSSALLPLPLSHVYGLMVSVMSLHAPGPGTSVLMRWFDPATWLELAQSTGSTSARWCRRCSQMLLQQPLEDYDLSALARLTSGSAPLPPQVAEDSAAGCRTSRSARGTAAPRPRPSSRPHRAGRSGVGSVGRPAPGRDGSHRAAGRLGGGAGRGRRDLRARRRC